MQKVVIVVVIAVVVLGGGYFFLMSERDAEEIPAQVGPSISESKVVIKNFAFSPNALRVKAGTKVTWTNDDVAGHSVTSDTGVFDSGVLSPGKSFERVFAQKGTFAYHCEPHPSMKATIIVE